MCEGRARARNQRLRVTFPNGRVFCSRRAIDTMCDVLNEIGTDRFRDIRAGWSWCNAPLVMRDTDVYDHRHRQNQLRPLCDGWYLNVNGTRTDQKYMLLRAISNSLGLNLTIKTGEDLELTEERPRRGGGVRNRDRIIRVEFPDGTCIQNDSPLDTVIDVIDKLGIDNVERSLRNHGVLWNGRPIIAAAGDAARAYCQIDENRWFFMPGRLEEKMRLLWSISLHMRANLNITLIDKNNRYV